MKYLSVCSGIEAATVAWHPLGWSPLAFSEIDAFPSAVLQRYYPDVPNRGDMTKFKDWPDAGFDLLVGGTPCQSFSVAGLREGLDDPRGSLMLTYLAIAGRYRPRWLVWENVPGVLSSDDGRAFGSLLGGLAILGYGFAYRVLDAQYFRLAQRRKRVFVVGHLGDWRRAAAVLFERESLSGHPAPRREARQAVAGSLGAGSKRSGGRVGRREAAANHLIPQTVGALTDGAHMGGGITGRTRTQGGSSLPDVSLCLNAGAMGRIDAESETLIPTGGFFDVAHTLLGKGNSSHAADLETYVTHALRADGFDASIQRAMQVRRLTPLECERLQGFPDNYTRIPYGKRRKPAKDGPRYKGLGNSMAVPVMRWLGRRIALVDALRGDREPRCNDEGL